MEKISESLREYAEKNIFPLYNGVDKAHGPEHVRTVLANSLELAESLLAEGQEIDLNMVYTVAVYHDVGIRYGRKDHEVNSGKWLIGDKELERWFTPEQRRIMQEAVEDHRASRQEPPRNMYGRIVSEADRDLEPERIVRRCMEYGVANCPDLSDEEQIRRTLEHVRDKYGEGGYLHLWLPCPKNEKGLHTLREWLKTGELEQKCRAWLQKEKAGKKEKEKTSMEFRKMRRKNQDIPQEECLEILKRSTAGVLAVLGDGEYPYAVPLSFVFCDGKLYFHCAREGHKLDALKRSPKASFCVIDQDRIVPEEYTTYYRSVIAFGQAEVVTDFQEQHDALLALAEKYCVSDTPAHREEKSTGTEGYTAVIRLTIEHLTGKEGKTLAAQRREGREI